MNLYPKWWRRHFLWAEFVIASLIGALFAMWVVNFHGNTVVDCDLQGDRGALYSALASIWGALLGFVITAISVILGLADHERLTIVRGSKHYGQLWKVFTSAGRALGFSALAALSGLIFDREKEPNHFCLEVCLWLSVLSIMRLARCLWVLEQIIKIVTSHAQPKLSNHQTSV